MSDSMKNQKTANELYSDRKLAQGYPELEGLSLEWFTARLGARPDDRPRVEKLLGYLSRLVDLGEVQSILVIGCGPKPQIVKVLVEMKYNVTGIEPMHSYVDSAREYVGVPDSILIGSAEEIPVDDNSQHLVFAESVLEHVDSPMKSLQEVYRVLTPGGIAVIITTNRYKISLRGDNGEFNVRFFNWLPDLVKECFVFHHLHYDPSLANYTPRPAVHWYSYTDLCKLGREAGFAQFYSILDLVIKDDLSISRSRIRLFLLNKLKYNPWLRALALTQLGGMIIALKRL